MQNNNIVLTGGHAATTAVAVVQEIQKRNKTIKLAGKTSKDFDSLNIYWIGSRWAVEGSKVESLEYKVLPKLGVEFLEIRTGRLQRKFTRWTIPSLVKIPFGFVDSFRQLRKTKPKVILSFGGYAAFPVVVCAKLLSIPVILHEQTIAVGRANKLSSPFADVVTLARPESKSFFRNKKTVVVGNPVMENILKLKTKTKIGTPPCIFITGGSRGAQSVNSLIKPIIRKLLKEFVVIHHTGSIDLSEFVELKEKIETAYQNRYTVCDFIDPFLIHEVYKTADIVVARAGANTVAEILITKRPAILIPLPFSYLDEQKKNALLAQKYGLAKVLEQNELTSEKLYQTIIDTKNEWSDIVKIAEKKISPDIYAASSLVDNLEEYTR
jgi:UDP-N-acetylglucosamine--N-acetylmuramyl-(pentapeptide) pyrophosphoryl-undecaprenol N-acetylglucosamine transferase